MKRFPIVDFVDWIWNQYIDRERERKKERKKERRRRKKEESDTREGLNKWGTKVGDNNLVSETNGIRSLMGNIWLKGMKREICHGLVSWLWKE